MAGSKSTQKGSMQTGRTWKFHTEKPQLVSGFEPSCCKARVLTTPPLTFYLKFDSLGASVAYNSKCDQTWQGTVVFSVICLFNYDVMGWCFFSVQVLAHSLSYLPSCFPICFSTSCLCFVWQTLQVIPPIAHSVARLSFKSLSSSFPVVLAIQYFILSKYLYEIVGWISVSLSIKLPFAYLKKIDKIAVVNQPQRWTTCVKSWKL